MTCKVLVSGKDTPVLGQSVVLYTMAIFNTVLSSGMVKDSGDDLD